MESGQWTTLDMWRLVEGLPLVNATYLRAFSNHLAANGLDLAWQNFDAAQLRRANPSRTA